jgi:hypothetical protein
VRLQLSLALVPAAACALVSNPVSAEGNAKARSDVYADEWIVVVSPAALAETQIGPVTVEGGFSLDVLSGATPVLVADAMTSATYFSETRRDGHVSVTYAPGSTASIDARAVVSVEPDHVTAQPGVGASVELFDRMTTLEVDYAFSHERVGSVHEPGLWARTLGHAVNLRWTQILGRTSSLSVVLSGQRTDCERPLGCQANPYRRVAVFDEDGGLLTTARESHPGLRMRAALGVRLAQYLGAGFALHAWYRFYADTWQMTAHTGQVSIARGFLDDRLTARVEGRMTWQDSASFFADDYVSAGSTLSVPEFRSADRELSRMLAGAATLRCDYRFPSSRGIQLSVNSRLSRAWYRYANYHELPRRNAWMVGAGLGLDY